MIVVITGTWILLMYIYVLIFETSNVVIFKFQRTSSDAALAKEVLINFVMCA